MVYKILEKENSELFYSEAKWIKNIECVNLIKRTIHKVKSSYQLSLWISV